MIFKIAASPSVLVWSSSFVQGQGHISGKHAATFIRPNTQLSISTIFCDIFAVVVKHFLSNKYIWCTKMNGQIFGQRRSDPSPKLPPICVYCFSNLNPD